jgi:3-oxoacyl-[acyl-carrier protein] reductase
MYAMIWLTLISVLFLLSLIRTLCYQIKTNTAFNRLGEPEDIAKVISFLVSGEAKRISAQNIGVDDGMA